MTQEGLRDRRVALVTGASRGIGRATALALASDDLAVAVNYRSDDGGAKETVRAIEEAGGTAAPFRADVSDEGQVREMFGQVREWAGPPLVVVCNAGWSRDGLAVRYALSDFQRALEVNLQGTFLCAREALPAMLRARWGRIVAVSSVVGIRTNPGQAAYGATKAGILGLAGTLAKEYAGRGITVNTVAPGFIDTAMTGELNEEQRRRLEEQIPAGRVGTPEEVASVIRFLASEEARYVNGAVVTIDGGLTA